MSELVQLGILGAVALAVYGGWRAAVAILRHLETYYFMLTSIRCDVPLGCIDWDDDGIFLIDTRDGAVLDDGTHPNDLAV